MKTLLISLLICLPLAVFADESISQLFVRGQAQLQVAPDQVTVSFAVITQDAQVKNATADNSKAMNQTMKALKKLGIEEDDISTQGFSIQPQWAPRSRLSTGQDNTPPKIIGYQVRNSIIVKTTRLDAIGEIIQTATESGVNQVNHIHFGLQSPRKFREQAIQEATLNAQKDAESLAAASGNKLGDVLKINLDNAAASISRAQPELAQARVAYSLDAASVPPIQAGDVTVNASVSITYAISSK